jgi:hypothetical protein
MAAQDLTELLVGVGLEGGPVPEAGHQRLHQGRRLGAGRRRDERAVRRVDLLAVVLELALERGVQHVLHGRRRTVDLIEEHDPALELLDLPDEIGDADRHLDGDEGIAEALGDQ